MILKNIKIKNATHERPNRSHFLAYGLTPAATHFYMHVLYVPPSMHINRYYFSIKLLINILSALYYLCFKNRLHC